MACAPPRLVDDVTPPTFSVPTSMHARLRVTHPRANVRFVKLLAETLVGRSAECQLKIASTQVSRRHCRIAVRADGVYVEDLGSSNGTLLDGSPLPAHKLTYVAAESRLQVGPAEFVVEYEPARPASATAPPAEVEPIVVAAPEPAPAPVPESASVAPDDADAATGMFSAPEPTPEFAELTVAAEDTVSIGLPTVSPTAPATAPADPPRRMRSLFGLLRGGGKSSAGSAAPPAESPAVSDANVVEPVVSVAPPEADHPPEDVVGVIGADIAAAEPASAESVEDLPDFFRQL